jgi:ADP-heptose:LPS heptosyltransferase
MKPGLARGWRCSAIWEMRVNVLSRIWNKLEGNFSFYPRLIWEALARKRAVVLVEFDGSMGDLVCFFSSLSGLRARHAGCCLIVVVQRDYVELVRCTGLVDFAAVRYGFFHLFARRLCRPGLAYWPTAAAGKESEVKDYNPPVHTILDFARIMGVEAHPEAVFLRAPEGLRRRMQRRLAEVKREGRPLVVFHLGPTWAVKEWPEESWRALGERLEARLQVRAVQIGTEASASALHAHAVPRLPFAVDWVNRLTIMESVAVLEQSRLFVGIDSGPLHLATTLGIPTIGLFGPVHGPYRAHPRARFTCLTADVPCLGCHHNAAGPLHWRTGCPYDIRCMKEIVVETVLGAIQDALSL